MSKEVDARGLSCPEPVILARKAVKAGSFPIEVLVDTVTSRDNVKRAVEKLGCNTEYAAEGDVFRITVNLK